MQTFDLNILYGGGVVFSCGQLYRSRVTIRYHESAHPNQVILIEILSLLIFIGLERIKGLWDFPK